MTLFREYLHFLKAAVPWLLTLLVALVAVISLLLTFMLPIALATNDGNYFFLLLFIPFAAISMFLVMLWFKMMEWVDSRG